MEFVLPLPKHLDQNGVLFKQWTNFYERFHCHQSSVSVSSVVPDTHSVLLFASSHNLDGISEALKVYNLDLVKLSRVLEIVEQVCLPGFLLLFERFRYFTLEQEASETLTDFVNVMRKQIDLCEFGDAKSSIMATALANGSNAEGLKRAAQNKGNQNLDDSEAAYSNHSDASLTSDNNTVVARNSVTVFPKRSAADGPNKQKAGKKKAKAAPKSVSMESMHLMPLDNLKDEMNPDDLFVQTRSSDNKKAGKTTTKKKTIQWLESQSDGPKTFLCFKCDKEYSCRGTFRRHVVSKHGNCKEFFCKHCKITFHNRKECITHCKGHKTSPISGPRGRELRDENSEYICWYCEKTLPNFDEYKKHCTTHSAVRVFSCDICQRKNHTFVRLIGHLKGHLKARYRCEICANCFGRAELLAAHMLSHEAQPVHQCQVCDKTFVSADRLQAHMRTHLGEKLFTCELCGRSFCQKITLDHHKLAHAGEKPYECDICGKRTACFGYLKKHKQIHSGKRPYVCEVCGKDFHFFSSLTRHRNGHTGKRAFGCEVCGRTFIYRGGLRDHIKANRCPGRKQEGIVKPASRSPRSKVRNVPSTPVSSTQQVVATYAPVHHQRESLLNELPHWQYVLCSNEQGVTDEVVLVPPY